MSYSYEELPRKPSHRLWGWLAVVVILFTLGAMLLPAINQVREGANRASCFGQFKFFGLAMSHYEFRRGTFPPAYVADSGGQAQHSWRVLLLEFLGDPIYQKYDFDEPWNSPHNGELSAGLHIGMSRVYPAYHCPSDRASVRLDTSYVMVVGEGTVSDGPKAIRREDVTDGCSNTIAIAEMAASGITWMKPQDLEFDEMSFKLNDFSTPCLRSKHGSTITVGTLDGFSRSISTDIDTEVLRALLTISGRERIPWETFHGW